jgi:lipoyl(octanoyl) transferase
MKLPEVRPLGRQPYDAVREAMRAFTQARSDDTADEIWLVEHPPVFTQGVAGRDEHLLLPGDIPVLRTERGGQVTYHGPGQVLAYPLVDLKRLGIYVKEFVFRLEGAVLQTLEDFGVTGHRVRGAPGIYVRLDDPFGHAVLPAPPAGSSVVQALQGLGKIAALGIKVSQHRSWHGLALNVAMDLEPFSRIDPCGYAGLKTVDLASLGVPVTWDEASQRLGQRLAQKLS